MRDNARRRRGAVKFDFHIARCINLTFLEHSSASAHERQSCSGLGGARASLAHAARHSTSMNLWFLTHSPSRAHCSHFSGVAAPRAPRAPRCPAAKRKQSRRILPRSARVGASRLVECLKARGKAAVSHGVTRHGEQRWRSQQHFAAQSCYSNGWMPCAALAMQLSVSKKQKLRSSCPS